MDTTPETSRSIKGGDALATQPPEFPPDVGIVIVGHGTANPTGAAETAAVAEQVARLIPGLPVELGYLEVIEPSIDVAVGRLAGRGCRAVRVSGADGRDYLLVANPDEQPAGGGLQAGKTPADIAAVVVIAEDPVIPVPPITIQETRRAVQMRLCFAGLQTARIEAKASHVDEFSVAREDIRQRAGKPEGGDDDEQ